MSEDQTGQEPTYGEETGQEPTYPMDGDTASAEDGKDETSQADSHPHGSAHDIGGNAGGHGSAETPKV